MFPNVSIHENVADMRILISGCDIGAEWFAKLGLAINLGNIRVETNLVKRIISAVEELCINYDKRVKIGKHMQGLIDGLGAQRIVKDCMNLR